MSVNKKRTFIIRLDDACPTMKTDKWQRIEEILDRFSVKPLVGVIPDNKDEKQMYAPYDSSFWNRVSIWQDKGWDIALHGYSHVYTEKEAGILPYWRKSEFAGVPYDLQAEKIKKGLSILSEHGIRPMSFFAPSHTFDINTLRALHNNSDIRIISDGISFSPYVYKEFIFIPQLSGHCISFPFPGIYTFCFHPNTMIDYDFEKLVAFLTKYHHFFHSVSELDLSSIKGKRVKERVMEWLFFRYRRIRGLW